MESFVQMSLREYDILKFGNENLQRELKEEQESHSEDVAQAKKEQELIMKKLRKKQDADLRKLKKAVQNKKYVDEFVKKLKEQEQWLKQGLKKDLIL